MAIKINNKPMDHNVGTHAENMRKRRLVQQNRLTTYRKIKTGKYTQKKRTGSMRDRKNTGDYDTSKINDDWRPSCPFCHASWADDMIELENKGSGCDTCGWGGGIAIDITCHKCKKLIYKKETY